jgi:Na+/pantothenate symporter
VKKFNEKSMMHGFLEVLFFCILEIGLTEEEKEKCRVVPCVFAGVLDYEPIIILKAQKHDLFDEM